MGDERLLKTEVLYEKQPLVSFSIIRHGEPEEYGASGSHLSLQGKTQVRNLARKFSDQLIQLGEPAIIWGFHSGQERTVESIEEYYEELKKNLSGNPLFVVHDSRVDRVLDVTGFLNSLERGGGIPGELVYAAWLSDEEAVRGLGEQLIARTERISKRFSTLEIKQRLYFHCFTHEPFFGAYVKALFPNPIAESLFPNYCEVLQIGSNLDGRVRFEFRGEVIWKNF